MDVCRGSFLALLHHRPECQHGLRGAGAVRLRQQRPECLGQPRELHHAALPRPDGSDRQQYNPDFRLVGLEPEWRRLRVGCRVQHISRLHPVHHRMGHLQFLSDGRPYPRNHLLCARAVHLSYEHPGRLERRRDLHHRGVSRPDECDRQQCDWNFSRNQLDFGWRRL